ncbi:protein yippee-like At3g08990 [Beta vulgaris subsp. vulgaris]|uniref:protein yippee-like At3g08990 n=1 Tax=Beta vulgaris subsp. vulgaris TaxID=3555 RepID=UPI002036768B|nr:protein yippee-like At3g08990 [Beta vulgaris subsp. vulgaris]
MGRLFLITSQDDYYTCKYCGTPLGLPADIISKSLHCRHGTAYLFKNIVNITVEENVPPVVIIGTGVLGGMQKVEEIFCVRCGSDVGWKYEDADELSQRYKQAKFMLGRKQLLNPWEHAFMMSVREDAAAENTDDA